MKAHWNDITIVLTCHMHFMFSLGIYLPVTDSHFAVLSNINCANTGLAYFHTKSLVSSLFLLTHRNYVHQARASHMDSALNRISLCAVIRILQNVCSSSHSSVECPKATKYNLKITNTDKFSFDVHVLYFSIQTRKVVRVKKAIVSNSLHCLTSLTFTNITVRSLLVSVSVVQAGRGTV